MLLQSAKSGAHRRGLPFELSLCDIFIPENCPVLGTPLFFTPGERGPNTPSLDRVDNQKGYVKGNVVVVSWRANQLKRDASLDEIRRILKYMETYNGGS